MEIHRDVEAENELLERLERKYMTVKPLPHLTELIYCLTRSYFDRVAPLKPAKDELVRFAIGFGLEAVILRDEGEAAPESVKLDGIWMTPDYVMLGGGELDLKSTRMRADRETLQPSKGFPETWLEQFKGYANRLRVDDAQQDYVVYSVGIIYTGMPTDLAAFTFVFTAEELDDFWQYIQERRGTYIEAHGANAVPAPFTYNKDWECKAGGGCRYLPRCQAIAGGQYD